MFDPEELAEARRQGCDAAKFPKFPKFPNYLAAAWPDRKLLAYYRGDRRTIESISDLSGLPVAYVAAAIYRQLRQDAEDMDVCMRDAHAEGQALQPQRVAFQATGLVSAELSKTYPLPRLRRVEAPSTARRRRRPRRA